MSKLRTTAIAAIGMLALAGCSSSEPDSEATVQPDTAPSISVPDTTGEDAVQVQVNPGSLESGEVVRVSAFGGDFDTENITCNEEVKGADLRVSGSGQDQSLTVPLPGPGIYQLTLSAPGYNSDCDSDNARTTAKTTPKIFVDGNLKADGETTYTRTRGKAFDASVILTDGVPKLRPLPVKLNVLGPYSTEPELRASSCDEGKTVSSQNLQWNGEKRTGTGTPYDTTTITIDDVPGLYLVTASLQETEQNYSAATQCDNYQSVMKVELKGK